VARRVTNHIGEGSKWLPDPMWFPHDNMQQEFKHDKHPKETRPEALEA